MGVLSMVRHFVIETTDLVLLVLWRNTYFGAGIFLVKTFPCFRTSADWYYVKLLKRSCNHLTEKLSDSTASSWTNRLYKASGIRSSKTTHAGRVNGAQIAELNGVSEDQVN